MSSPDVPQPSVEAIPEPQPIPMRPISFAASTQIASIDYDEENMQLFVSFQRGGIYRYFQVTSDIADGFTQAPSAGGYLAQFVKGSYDYEKIG